MSYIKDAKFVPRELKESWPAAHRRAINHSARAGRVPRLVELSRPVVEAGVYDSDDGTALVLANFTYRPIEKLAVRVPLARRVEEVRSVEHGPLEFDLGAAPRNHREAGHPFLAIFELELGLDDIILLR